MTTQALERVQQWETRSFAGGYRGLHDLADQEFSGVVRATGGTLCMLNGAVVGIVGGTIEDFAQADGTAYAAPSPALPLLIVMQERSDEVRGKYYTEDTPLSTVDSTLSDGGFTGYVELSENVHSGDYYVVYHGGRSMSVAFVGESSQLHTDEDAFELADDEVGIYEVRPVDITPIEIPEPASTSTAGDTAPAEDSEQQEASEDTGQDDSETESEAGSAGSTATTEDDSGEESADERSDEAATDDSRTGSATGRRTSSDAEQSSETTSKPATADTASTQESNERAERSTVTDTGDSATVDTARSDTGSDRDATRSESSSASPDDRAAKSAQFTQSSNREQSTAGTDRGSSRSPRSPSSASVDSQRDRTGTSAGRPAMGGSRQTTAPDSPADLETRTIPSLDPSRTDDTQKGSAVAVPTRPRNTSGTNEKTRSGHDSHPTNSASTERSPAAGDTPATNRSPASPESNSAEGETGTRVSDLQERISQREERIETLEEKLDRVQQERDDLRTERDDLQVEVQQLQDELSAIIEERDALESTLEDSDADADREAPERRLGRREAMEGTDLFVRYNSKGDPTLKTAHESGAGQTEVNDNLNVESHTQFERTGTVVSGEPFEDFLAGTIEHRFVSWVVRELLFEIRDTGHQDALAELYDALPRVDRAELNGITTVEYTEDGQTKRSQETFDIVLRDRMGNPLVVANINDSRQAASEDQMSSLVTAATRVAESNPSLAGAMFVTASFFEPGALETAADATGGGLLSRDKRESFVKTSRKQGYHLCLVEARDDKFHMAVPDL